MAKHWCLSEKVELTTLVIYVLAGYAAPPATVYLKSVGRAHRWPEKRDDDLQRLVEDLFLSFDLGLLATCVQYVFYIAPSSLTLVLHRYTDTERPFNCAIMAKAMRYVTEWNLVAEGRQLNLRLGLAVPTRMLLDTAQTREGCLPATVLYSQSLSPFGRPSGHGRVWARRFRQRWGARVGKIRLSEPISAEEMKRKVMYFCCDIFRLVRLYSICHSLRCVPLLFA